jgi:hypothetical protein
MREEQTLDPNVGLSIHNKNPSISKSNLISRRMYEITRNVADPIYFNNVYRQDAESILNLLQNGGRFSPVDIKRAHPLCDVCAGCGLREQVYAPFRKVCRFTIDYLLPELEYNNDLARLLVNVARAEYAQGERDYVHSVISTAEAIHIDLSAENGIDLVSKKIRVVADLDSQNLSGSREFTQFKERAYGRNSVDHVQAMKCLACKAVGLSVPEAESHLAALEDAVPRLPDGPVKSGLERDIYVLKAVRKYSLLKKVMMCLLNR